MVRDLTGHAIPEAPSILPRQAGYLIATAARAPSVHNTQPWRFRVGQSAIELYCDPRRRLRVDPDGRHRARDGINHLTISNQFAVFT